MLNLSDFLLDNCDLEIKASSFNAQCTFQLFHFEDEAQKHAITFFLDVDYKIDQDGDIDFDTTKITTQNDETNLYDTLNEEQINIIFDELEKAIYKQNDIDCEDAKTDLEIDKYHDRKRNNYID